MRRASFSFQFSVFQKPVIGGSFAERKMMSRILAVLGVAVWLVALAGCGSREYTGEQRFPVSGKVTVDGEPMEFGLISLLPQGEGGRVSGGPIKNGSYAIEEPMGPTAGKYRVEIRWNKPTGRRVKDAYGEEIMDEYKEGLPAKYHTNSELTADVSSKKTTFDFELETN
jgi:hypothetical protein